MRSYHQTKNYEKNIIYINCNYYYALTACGKLLTTDIEENSERRESFGTTELSRSTELPEEEKESIPKEAFDLSALSPIGALKKVLLSEAPFYCTNIEPYINRNIIREYSGYLNKMPYGSSEWIVVTPQFTILDLDGDEILEVVLAIEDYMGSIVLRYQEGRVVGHLIDYRSMHNIQENASFYADSSAMEYYTQKLFFIGNTVMFDCIQETNEGIYETYYYLHDVPVDEATIKEFDESRSDLKDVGWYDFTEEAIQEKLVDNSGNNGKNNERQDYLDSLAYLIDKTYDYSNKEQETFNKDGKRYYYNSIAEMNKIYELCKGKFSGSELMVLEEEQREWQEGIDLRLARDLWPTYYSVEQKDNWDLYYTYGSMILTRAFHLINMYYDCHFYD